VRLARAWTSLRVLHAPPLRHAAQYKLLERCAPSVPGWDQLAQGIAGMLLNDAGDFSFRERIV
jgi:hypothetical protein